MATRPRKRPTRRTSKPAGQAAPVEETPAERAAADAAAEETPATDVEPTTEVEPATDVEPTAGVEPTTDIEPTAEVEPSAEIEPTAAVERPADAVAEARPAASEETYAASPSSARVATSAAPPARRRRGSGRLARRRVLPWSERSVLAMSLLLVLVSTPLWLDPSALYELGWGGRPSATDGAPPTPPVAPRPTSAGSPAARGEVLASDTFSRRSAAGWGAADVGGRYVLEGEVAQLSVEPGVGVIRVADGDGGSVVLPRIEAQDVSLEMSLAFDQLPSEDELLLFAELRRNERGGGYRPVVHVRSDGSLLVGAGLRLGTTQQELGSTYVVPDLRVGAGDVLRLRAEASGSDPTTIQLRIWPGGEPEPSFWHVSVIDWSGALQGAGSMAIGWQLESGAPVTLRIDDMILTTTHEGESQ